MRAWDVARLVTGTVRAQPLRAGLTALGIAVGITAVVLLTAIGQGVRDYVVAQFTQFGTNLIAVTPGRSETFGASGGIIGSTRPLTLDDAQALGRAPFVEAMAPVVQGNARVEAADRSRRTLVLGVGPQAPKVWRFGVALGRFLPPDDPRSARPYAVLGAKLKAELFGDAKALGARLRIGQNRFRVLGVMESKGQVLGFDIDDAVYIPAARALELFDREGLMEIDLVYNPEVSVARVEAGLRRILLARHGREDFTITSQAQMLSVLGDILNILTGAVAGLGGISLLVGGVGILTIMTIGVTERTNEIGLLRALGARQGQVLLLFLGEAVCLALLGGLAGLALGAGLAALAGWLVPALPVRVSPFYALLALGLSMLIGAAAGVLPARRAARLDPVEALRAE